MKHILLGAVFVIALLAVAPTASASSLLFLPNGDFSLVQNTGVFGVNQSLYFNFQNCDIAVHNADGFGNFANLGGLIALFGQHIGFNLYNVFGLTPTFVTVFLGTFVVNVGC